MKVALDTNAYSELFRGDKAILELLAKAHTVYLPVVVIGELRAGFKMGSREQKNLDDLDNFLSKPSVSVLETSQEMAEIYAVIVSELKKVGRKIPTNDIWIAAHAMSVGAKLITYDKHFTYVPGLRL